MTQFHGTGAHLSANELRVWTSFLDSARIIETELSQHLASEHAMTHREYEVLVRLDGAGGRNRMSHLARQIEASGPLVTQTVGRLESKGWVERCPSERDGRGVDAQLTESGRTALSQAAKPHAQLVKQLLLNLLGDDLDPVAQGLGRVADHLRSHRSGDGCTDSTCPIEV